MKFVAVTACPTGIAHTYMAAEALKIKAEELGYDLKVETRGSVGAEDELTPEDIAGADAVIVAADAQVPMDRFNGKKLIEVPVADAIKDPESLFKKASAAPVYGKSLQDSVDEIKSERSSERKGVYKHLMTGVSFMIPFVVAGGLLIAFSFIFGIEAFKEEGTLAAALMTIGGGSAFALMIPILSGYIAFSIADRPGLVPGMVGGMLAASANSGFLGGIIAGFLAGYVAKAIRDNVKLPKSMAGLMPVLVIPVFSTLIVGLVMIYVVGKPVGAINTSMNEFLKSMSGTNSIILGLLLGLMMAFDMGGPINKAAYAFGVSTLVAGATSPIMAAVMAAGMTPPLGIALATTLFSKKFTAQEHEAGKAAWAMGISFITEGAIPFAAADPLRVIPSIMVGSAVTGALSMLFNCGLAVPHGGIFVLFIPNAVSNLAMYIVSIAAGVGATAAMLFVTKKDIA
ncbi:MAG: PTS transporter subunit EIIC [Clostridia bacterium]|nr:PTS transporter subunit EIIC [Clostridia bacterium]